VKICKKCNIEKSLNDFHKKSKAKDGYQTWCKICNRESRRDYYSLNSKRELKRNRSWEQKEWEWYNSLKTGPCGDCGLCYHPAAMQWDHLPLYDKVDCVSNLMRTSRGRQKVIEEIAKCELVCANCHAIRTWTRRVS
jgi:hypothetical protein